MKLTKVKFLYATLVALGIAVMPANAATDPTWTANDVIFGFRAATGTTGAGTSLLVNLGPAATYRDTAANINSIANLGSTISSVYGSTWYDRTDLWAGFVSATNGTNIDNNTGNVAIASQTTDYHSTIYVSTVRTSQGTEGVAGSNQPGNPVGINSQSAGGYISTMRGIISANDLSGTGIAQLSSGLTNSWNTYVTGSSSVDFGVFDIESNFASGVAYSSFGGVNNVEQAWDFYRVAKFDTTDSDSGKGLFQGTFTIDQSGGVDFIVTSAAVPEPSTYMMSGLALAIGAYLFRRKNKKTNKPQIIA